MDQRRSGEEPEVLDTRPAGPGRPVWVAVIVGCCCLIVVGLVWRATGQDRAGGSATNGPSVGNTTGASATADTPVSHRTTRTVDLGWLSTSADEDIFLRTTSGVVRIRPSTGQVVQTSIPGLASSGPVAFQPVADGVLIHPLDLVAGYRVPDDATAQETKATGGVMLPGPDDQHVWVETGGNDLPGLRLVADTAIDSGSDSGSHADARIPAMSTLGLGKQQELFSDGRGYVLGEAVKPHAAAKKRHVVYRLGVGAPKRLPIAHPIAVGPTRVLGVSADCKTSCPVIELNARFEKAAHQPRLKADPDTIGIISPDGRTAALMGGDRVPHLVDLHTGKQTPARSLQAWVVGQVAFSPDGRWLFGIGPDKRAYAVDVRTGRTRLLLRDIPGVLQLAVRSVGTGQ